MPSLEQVRTRKFLTRGVVGQVGADASVVFMLRYIDSGSVTSVTVTPATDITMVTVKAGTTYTDAYTWISYTTVGALVAAINATGRFEAKVMDALSTSATGAGLLSSTTLTADANGVYKALSDTSGCLFMAYRLTYERGFKLPAKIRSDHRVAIQEIVTNLTLGATNTNAFKIYECVPGDNSEPYPSAETLIYQKTPVSAAPSTQNWADGESEITSNEGNDLLFIVSDTVSFGATDTITVIGKAE
jgi:hypothetical protein